MILSKKKELRLSAYLTNLSAYNRGELIGEWVDFPITKRSLNEVYKKMGIGQKNDYGEIDEEIFITDYDGIPSKLHNSLGEYESIDDLQVLGKILEVINNLGNQEIEIFEYLLENYDYLDAAANVIDDKYRFISGVEDTYDLGCYIVEEIYGGTECLPQDTLERYFNYDSFGRDIRLEYYKNDDMPETVQKWLGLEEWATDEEIGIAYEDICGGFTEIANPENYFDFKRFGRDIEIEGFYIYTDNGVIDCTECDSNIGNDLYNDIKDELIAENILNDHQEPLYDEEER